ncbi:SDR family NAD(P)-dependent oxidoreductase [Streptomyces sp. NPDC002589]|uniref:SDR family NAD(P)-dependent oxidoreductase n=1 Tax=Streptomyces sp. NPDC002589 TaxID=3154420 RepID=UPI003329AE92
MDLTDRADMHEAAEYLTRTFGHLDVLINNASDMPDFEIVSPLDADLGEASSAMEVDVIGPWGLVQSMLPLLTAAPAARIVNVSSLSALQIAIVLDIGASLRAPAYSMAKHMLNALTSVLARDFKDTPILVKAVDLGETATHPERGDDDNDRPAAESARGVVWAATLGSGVAASRAATLGGREIRLRTQAEVNEALALLQIGKPAGTGAVVAVSTLEPMEGRREDLVEVLTELAPQIRAEPGCMHYSVHRPRGGADGPLLVIQMFTSIEAFRDHSAGVADQIPRIGALLAAPPAPPTLFEPVSQSAGEAEKTGLLGTGGLAC